MHAILWVEVSLLKRRVRLTPSVPTSTLNPLQPKPKILYAFHNPLQKGPPAAEHVGLLGKVLSCSSDFVRRNSKDLGSQKEIRVKGTSKFQPQCDPRVLGRTLLQIGHKRRQRLEWHIMGCMVDHPKVEAAPLQHKRWTMSIHALRGLAVSGFFGKELSLRHTHFKFSSLWLFTEAANLKSSGT